MAYYVLGEDAWAAISTYLETNNSITGRVLLEEFFPESTLGAMYSQLQSFHKKGLLDKHSSLPMKGFKGRKSTHFTLKGVTLEREEERGELFEPEENETSVHIKLNKIIEGLPSTNQIIGFNNRLAAIESKLDSVTDRVSILNNKHMVEMKRSTMAMAESLLDICENLSNNINRLAALVFKLRQELGEEKND